MNNLSSEVHKNVEIKARIRDYENIISKVQTLCLSHGEIIEQEDTFFNVPNGRLKLRRRTDYSVSELIYYERPDVDGPKLSVYSKCNVSNGAELLNVLAMSLGIKGVVKKTRHLYIHQHTRIHIDDVKDLGKFVEIEVVLTKDQTLQDGETITENLMNILQIEKSDLITGAYLDMLLKKSHDSP